MTLADSSLPPASTDDLTRLHTLAGAQGFAADVDLDRFRAAERRADIGLGSLEVIMLIANYMTERGLDTANFSPDWVVRLDRITGIVAVLHDIDAMAGDG